MLNPHLRPRFVADIGERRRYEPIEFCERFLKIIDLRDERRVVTVVEFVSPGDKEEGLIRELYLQSQQEVLRSSINLVEIDLICGGGMSWRRLNLRAGDRSKTT
jgi:hypothetical protein